MALALGICGSPRKNGNTSFLLKEVLKVCKKGGCSTKLIEISDLDIKPCNSCAQCVKNGKCPIKDDIELIFSEFRKAKFIVVGSPVFRGSVSAQLKAIIDRSMIFYFREELFEGKIGSVVVVGRREGLGKLTTANLIQNFFLSLGMMVLPPLVIGSGMGIRGDVKDDASAVQNAGYLGERIVKLKELEIPHC